MIDILLNFISKMSLMRSFCLTILTCFAFFATQQACGQIITTFAGTGSRGYTGNGGPATAARFDNVFDVAVDIYNNIYVTDLDNNVVRKIDTNGIISTVVGNGFRTGVGVGSGGYTGNGGPATDAELNQPLGIAVDVSGAIYVGDAVNYVVRNVNPGGIINTIAGSHATSGTYTEGAPATASVIYPASSNIGVRYPNIYFIDNASHIRSVNILTGIMHNTVGNGIVGYSGDGGPATAAEMSSLSGAIIFDAPGNMYFADAGNNVVRKVNTSGIITTIAGGGYALHSGFSSIPGYSGDGGPATDATLNSPEGIAFDAVGNLFIADHINQVIRKVDTRGIITTFAGNATIGYTGDHGPAFDASFQIPAGIAIDNIGRIYIADEQNNVVRRIDTTSDHFPFFASGINDSIHVCENDTAVSLDGLLSVIDSDEGQHITWAVTTTPLHGVLSGFSSTMVSTGGMLLPYGFRYTPATGYYGVDTFRIHLTDSIASTRITVAVVVDPCLSLETDNNRSVPGEMKVSPNPSAGSFTAEIPGLPATSTLTVSDVLGRVVATRIVKATTNSTSAITVDGIPPGNYILRVSGDGRSYRSKLVIW